jgi:hypothetical protein
MMPLFYTEQFFDVLSRYNEAVWRFELVLNGKRRGVLGDVGGRNADAQTPPYR